MLDKSHWAVHWQMDSDAVMLAVETLLGLFTQRNFYKQIFSSGAPWRSKCIAHALPASELKRVNLAVYWSHPKWIAAMCNDLCAWLNIGLQWFHHLQDFSRT
jgi:hypothetical protein